MGKIFGGFFDKFKVADDYDDIDDYEDYEDEDEEGRPIGRFFKKNNIPKKSDSVDEDANYQMSSFFQSKRKVSDDRGNKIVPLKKTGETDSLRVSILRPKSVKEANRASDSLIEGRAVILNLEGIEEIEAQRIMDFVFGTMYTINGKFSQISSYIFMFLPKSGELDSDLEESVRSFALDHIGLSGNEFEIPVIRRDF